MPKSLGDFDTSAVVYGKFSTYRPSTGAAFTLAGTPALSVYKDNSTTQSTTGVTLTVDFDSVTGLHHFAIDTSADGTFYAAGSFFDIVITTGTVDSVSVVGSVVGSFTIRKNSALKPTTAGRTLVVDAAGLADANAVKIGPTGAGTAQTARDIGTSVLLSSGTGTGQVSLSSGGVSLSTSGLGAAADAVWDEATSGHVAAGSYGAQLQAPNSGTAQAGASTTITLASGASATNDYYKNDGVYILSGTGVGQFRFITGYVGATKVATVSAWATNPDNTSVYTLIPFGAIAGATAPTASENAIAVWDELRSSHVAAGSFGQYFQRLFRSGTAQGGTSSSITLDASASATNNLYKYSVINIIGGTGAGQSRQCDGYTGSSKVATVGVAWTTAPDATSVFSIEPLGVDAATLAAIADAVWDEARSGHASAGSFGEYSFADVTRLSGDATAADNAEAFFDGTGYAGTNNVIPSVTTVTTVGSVTGAVGSVTGAVGSVTGAVGSVTASVTVGTNSDKTGYTVSTVSDKTGYTLSNAGVDALFTRQLTEAYAADGAAPTVAQALMQIQQMLTEFSISSTTMTVKKLDGSTSAFTLTLNSASAPTSLTRAT